MTSIPQPATDYLARLVDPRKKAYAESCVACWQQGQPFAGEWPNLKAEYIQDVAAKMKRYLKVESVQRAPQSAVAEQTTSGKHNHGSPVPADAMAEIERHMAAGGELGIGGGYRFTTITNKAWQSWTKAGDWYVKPEGTGYRVRQGRKSSVYLFEGQLRWMNCECAEAKLETAKPTRRNAGKGVKAVVPASNPDVEQAAEVAIVPTPARKPTVTAAFYPAKLREERPEAMPPKWEEAQNPFPTKSAKWQSGRYGNNGSYHMRGSHAAFLKAIGEYDKPAGARINRPSRAKDAYVRSESLCSESMGGRPWNVVAAEMRGPKYRGWQAGDPTPDAVRPFSTMNTVNHAATYTEAAG